MVCPDPTPDTVIPEMTPALGLKVNGWDPNTTWIYKWNPFGLLEFGKLDEAHPIPDI